MTATATQTYREFRRDLARHLVATAGDVTRTYVDAVELINHAAGGAGGFVIGWYPGKESTDYDADAVRATADRIIEGIRAVREVGRRLHPCCWSVYARWGGFEVERVWPDVRVDYVRVYASTTDYHTWDGEAFAEVPVATTPAELAEWVQTVPFS